MLTHTKLDRRAFLASAAAGTFTLAMRIPDAAAQSPALPPEVNAWVVVKPDDTIVIRIARSEMGQGTLTGLAQLVAEELEADWSKVTTEYPTPGQNVARNRVWRDYSTGGSRGIRGSHDYVRAGGATAREMLIQAAATQWGVPAGECKAAKSTITHAASGRSTTYGKVAEAAAKVTLAAEPKLKDPKDWTIAGKPLKRLDTVNKLDGSQIYGMDLKLPGMVIAAIKDCPVFGGKLASYDDAKAKGMKGVKQVVKVGESGIAVVADTWWHAKSALDAVKVVWDGGANAKVQQKDINAILAAGLDAPEAFVGNEAGDAKGALAKSAKVVEATYAYPFLNHATMEAMNATALWTPEKCEVWCPTQNGEAALAATVAASGLPIAKCDVYKLHLGGGFGRRGMSDFVTQAVAIAKQMPGTPVKLIWSREEDMTHGRYHPITQCKLKAGFDDKGELTAFHMRISGQSILAGVNPQGLQNGKDIVTFQGLLPSGDGTFGYEIPNILIDHAMRNTHVPPGFWRGVNHNQNAIYLECFMDELAKSANMDPLAFRRKLMAKYPRHLGVLNAAAEKAGWGTPTAPGVFRGLAQHMGFGSYTAAVAEVSVTNGNVKVHRIVAATDTGFAVNPQQIAAQVEGSFAYGLSALFYGECTVKDGAIEETNFDTYNVIRMDEMPKVETIVMPQGGATWGGVGEPTISVAAPAVLNAIAAATGKRLRTFPLKNQDLKRA